MDPNLRTARMMFASAVVLAGLVVGHVFVTDLGHDSLPYAGWNHATGGNRTVVWTTADVAEGDEVQLGVEGSFPTCLFSGSVNRFVFVLTVNHTLREHGSSDATIRLVNTTGAFQPTNASTRYRVQLDGCISLKELGGGPIALWVVEDGDQYPIIANQTPARVYYQRAGPSIWNAEHRFVRPAPPVKPASADLNGTSVPVGANRIAFVLTIEGSQKENVTGLDSIRSLSARVEKPWADAAHLLLLFAEGAAVVLLVIAGRRYLRSPATPGPAPEGIVPAALALSERVEQYLRALRWYVRGLGLAMSLGWAALVVGSWVWAQQTVDEGPVHALPWLLAVGLGLAYGAIMAAWFRHYRRLAGEAKQWSAQRTSPPDIV